MRTMRFGKCQSILSVIEYFSNAATEQLALKITSGWTLLMETQEKKFYCGRSGPLSPRRTGKESECSIKCTYCTIVPEVFKHSLGLKIDNVFSILINSLHVWITRSSLTPLIMSYPESDAYRKWMFSTTTVMPIDMDTSTMVNNRYLPRSGTAKDVGGMISASSRKNTVNDTRMLLHRVTCEKANAKVM